jgi:hypothetical protein
MWEPRRLTNLWDSTACYTDSFTFTRGQRWAKPLRIRFSWQWKMNLKYLRIGQWIIYNTDVLLFFKYRRWGVIISVCPVHPSSEGEKPPLIMCISTIRPVCKVLNTTNTLTNSWEAASLSATQEFPSILWNPKVHCHVHSNPPLVIILNQINPVNTTPSCSSKIHFNIIHPPASRSS